jgi:hypothetical protein
MITTIDLKKQLNYFESHFTIAGKKLLNKNNRKNFEGMLRGWHRSGRLVHFFQSDIPLSLFG